MGRKQAIVLGIGVFAVFALFYLFDIRPPEASEYEEQRARNAAATTGNALIRKKLPKLPATTQSDLQRLNAMLENSDNRRDSLELLEQLSGSWYKAEEPAVAGYYAKKIAEMKNAAEAWSVCGTTFALGFHKADMDPIELDYSVQNARNAFENAISLKPENINHRINLAVTYAEQPEEGNPMRGIQMLLKLNREHPDDPAVLYQLGRFGIQTGQYEKAVERLERVVELDPQRTMAYCLLSKAYSELGRSGEAQRAREQCKQN